MYFVRWAVENQIGKKELIIDDCDSKQSVYVFGCKDSILQVKGNFLLSHSASIYLSNVIFLPDLDWHSLGEG